MSKPLSAVDCFSPSFERAKRQLFVPFRLGRWLRLAFVCLVIGDFAGGGGYTGGGISIPNIPSQPDRGSIPQTALGFLDWSDLQPFLPLLILCAVLVFALIIVWLYTASVYRFILFDSVLYDRCQLKGAWTRWEPAGRSYFFWLVSLFFASTVVSLLVGGGAALVGWRVGIFQRPSDHLALLILGGLALLCIMFVFFVVTALAALFAKDFCVPLMAIEKLKVLAAWRRLLPMLAAEKMAYAGFVLMKIVLDIGSAIIFGIITLVALIAVGIPLAAVGAALFFAAKAAGLAWNFSTISVVTILGAIVLSGILYVLAVISTPPMVFFQSYVIYFFGSRYAALGAIVFAPPPIPPPVLSVAEPPAIGPPPEPAIG
jgi:hypothetical protein